MTVQLLNRIENIVAEEEIDYHEQFLHLPHSVFKRCLLQWRQKAFVCEKELS